MSTVLKKRGRKPKQDKVVEPVSPVDKGAVRTELVKQNSLTSPPLILHLNISLNDENPDTDAKPHTKNFETAFYNYDPVIKEPIAYEQSSMSSLPETYKNQTTKETSCHTIKELFSKAASDTATQEATFEPCGNSNDTKYMNNTNAILLKDMVLNKEWVHQTNYWCYWDCHPFDTTPFGIPIKFKQNKFHMFGCFCSLECAVAYNFYESDRSDNRWENYNLINMLSNKINYKFCVNPAISRKCLNTFGGHLEIRTFREKNSQNKHYHILTYPMVSLMEQVEEINETIPYQKNYIPLDKSRIEKIEEANKEKILSKQKTNLEEKMDLKFID